MILLWNSSEMIIELMIIDRDERQWSYQWEAGRSLARDMLAYLRDRLSEHGASVDDISGIGVLRGPGSFTGLRIGLTVLNTLAAARTVPIVGAIGDDWQSECLERLRSGENDYIVLPEYGGDAHVTKPRK